LSRYRMRQVIPDLVRPERTVQKKRRSRRGKVQHIDTVQKGELVKRLVIAMGTGKGAGAS